MASKIFFSWQADRPNPLCRGFIGDCLRAAVDKVSADLEFEEAQRLEVDSDTRGVSGTPAVADTIFQKIDLASAFVADLTFVATRVDGRPSPNPNVLIEYGWATKSVTRSRIICVMNTAFGLPTTENLPFDLIHLRRPIQFFLDENTSTDERKKIKLRLVSELQQAISAVLKNNAVDTSSVAPIKRPFALAPSVAPGKFRKPDLALGIRTGGVSSAHEEVDLMTGPAMWLRVAPINEPGRTWTSVKLKDLATEFGISIQPLGDCQELDFVRAEDGFAICAYRRNLVTDTFVFVFRTGEIWAADYELVAGSEAQNIIPLNPAKYISSLQMYSGFLSKTLNIPRPHQWIAGIDGVKGRGIYRRDGGWSSQIGAADRGCVQSSGEILDDQSAKQALRPFFEELFSACGQQLPAELEKD